MRTTDQVLARYVAEIEERQQFIDGLMQATAENGNDLSDEQLELVTKAKDRIAVLNRQMEPLEEARRIGAESSERIAQLARFMSGDDDKPRDVQYRSAGEWIVDYWQAGLGVNDARERMHTYMRAAAHQTTADNPGLLPEQMLSPVLNFVDAARPLVNAIGPRQLPSGSWSRPKVTQHTLIGQQAGEKTELPSRKMIIGAIPVNAKTFGGYVNVSRQNVDWTQPQIMDLIVNDLAQQYAIETEVEAGTDFTAAATPGPTLPATPTGADVAAAIWEAAGMVYTAMLGAGRLVIVCSPDMLGLIGPLFAPVNPQNAQSTGFTASQFGQGALGAVSGVTVVVSAGLAAGTILVLSTAAVEIYEDRIGALQVVEPSVLGVQVAYAGYFSELVIENEGVVKIATTVGP